MNPFEQLAQQSKRKQTYDEWGGQFSCQAIGCNGYATLARHYSSDKVLSWKCQDGHVSILEDIND